MCQAYEAERSMTTAQELAEIKRRYNDHKSGANPLSNDELYKLAARKFVLLY